MIIFTRETKKPKIFRLKCHLHLVKLKDAVMNENCMKILHGIWPYVMKVA